MVHFSSLLDKDGSATLLLIRDAEMHTTLYYSTMKRSSKKYFKNALQDGFIDPHTGDHIKNYFDNHGPNFGRRKHISINLLR